MLFPVILAGGVGDRLWPTSNQSLPKQFASLGGGKHSLFQLTAQRLHCWPSKDLSWIVVTHQDYRFLATEQLAEIEINAHQIILEPFRKNTAAAIAVASMAALKQSSGAQLLILPSDHFISDNKYFCDLISLALSAEQPMTTFGVKPSHPEKGFGYIKVGNSIANSPMFEVEKFIEKPPLEVAKNFFESDDYLWNSGIFLLDAQFYLQELNRFSPEISRACLEAMNRATVDLGFLRIDPKSFEKSPTLSADCAVFENSKNLAVMPYESGWSDLGAWDSVLRQIPSDEYGNIISGDGIAPLSTNTFIHSQDRLVVALGVKDVIISETAGAVLVSHRENVQDVKNVVDKLRKSGHPSANEHSKRYRPWGNLEKVYEEKQFKIKKITVKPGKSLSIQKHYHRTEHWVVVQGNADVIIDGVLQIIKEGESIDIPKESEHMLRNSGSSDLVLVEVQYGDYLDNDDVIRFDNFSMTSDP